MISQNAKQMFALRGVTKKYGTSTVLDNIDCEIPTDQFVFVVGPSGSGKSTLLRLLALVEQPDSGEISLTMNGEVYSSQESLRPWPRLTCVFQRQFLWPHLTLRENVMLPLRLQGAIDADERFRTIADLFGMTPFIDRYPNEVSGGQAQRAALARALSLDPQIVLIDEAHGGLDLEQQARLNEHLLHIRSRGAGLIVISHALDFVARFADLIIVLEEGRVVETGPSSILRRPASRFLKAAIERPERIVSETQPTNR